LTIWDKDADFYGPKKDDVTEEWRKEHNEKRRNLNCSHTSVQVIESKKK